MFITQNPNIDMETEQQPNLYYLDDGVCFFKCIDDPENVIRANKGSIASSTNGSLYIKTTDNVATGWVAIGGGGGTPSLNQNEIAFGDAAKQVARPFLSPYGFTCSLATKITSSPTNTFRRADIFPLSVTLFR